jgi:hypothetical protein
MKLVCCTRMMTRLGGPDGLGNNLQGLWETARCVQPFMAFERQRLRIRPLQAPQWPNALVLEPRQRVVRRISGLPRGRISA